MNEATLYLGIILVVIGTILIFSPEKQNLNKMKELRTECVSQKRMLIDKYEGDKMVSWECAGNPQ